MDLDLGTPARDHLKFPHAEKSVDSVKKKVKKLAGKKKRTFDGSYVDESLQKNAKFPGKLSAKDGEKARRDGTKSLFKQHAVEPEKKKAKYLKETAPLEASSITAPKHRKQPGKDQKQELGTLSSPATDKTPWSSFPIVDSETEKR